MKNLIQFRYSVETNFFCYLKTENLESLIKGLMYIEMKAKRELDNIVGSLWFKFSEDDTIVTTIKDIETDLSLPKSHTNYKFLIEKIKNGIDLNGEILIYYS